MGQGEDWRDGFVFVGNQLSLDFLNTRPFMNGAPVELWNEPGDVLRWMRAAGLITSQQVREMEGAWHREAGPIMNDLWDFREKWRAAVFALEAGQPLASAFVREVNGLLDSHPFVDHLVQSPDGLKRRRRFEPKGPGDVLGPILDDVLTVATSLDRSRVRKCANCQLHFHDSSKKGTRRWCSMNICGNRAKVAAYSRRQREAGS